MSISLQYKYSRWLEGRLFYCVVQQRLVVNHTARLDATIRTDHYFGLQKNKRLCYK